MRNESILEPRHAAACRIIVRVTSEEEQIRCIGPLTDAFAENDLRELPRAPAIVGDDGRRSRPWQIDVDAPHARSATEVVQPIRIAHAGDQQEFDLLRQQCLDRLKFVSRVSMRANDDRAKSARPRSAFECFSETGKKPVAVVGHDHPGKSGPR